MAEEILNKNVEKVNDRVERLERWRDSMFRVEGLLALANGELVHIVRSGEVAKFCLEMEGLNQVIEIARDIVAQTSVCIDREVGERTKKPQ